VEDKITDLEIRVTHQEASIEEINAELLRQHNQIESLIANVQILQKQIRDLGENNIADLSHEPPPPHY